MLLQEHIDTKLPFVIFKKPASGKLHIIQQKNSNLYTDNTLQTEGFYFAPFDLDKHPVVVFPETESNRESFFLRQFKKLKSPHKLQKKTVDNQQETHIRQVKKAMEKIEKGWVKKVIISRTQPLLLLQFDGFTALLRLMNRYENSYVYAWFHPEVGMWMGATPEVLGKYEKGLFQTMALAGTIPVATNQPVIWQDKEIAEQQFVTDYISQKLSAYSEKVNVSSPATLFQGKIAHIKTDITAQIDASQLSKLVLSLHPTPAVCGVPTPQARELITRIEAYDRKYYTGFLGEITRSSADLMVNLRCLEIVDNQALLYVGGGITADSNPENEWLETVYKSDVLYSVLQD